jgi:hypothetical protein
MGESWDIFAVLSACRDNNSSKRDKTSGPGTGLDNTQNKSL